MKEIFLLRHGQTNFNFEKRVQGRGIDSSLNQIGILQSISFFEYYKEYGFDLIITSSLKRTEETIRPFLNHFSLPKLSFTELDEISWGIYEGKPATKEMHIEHKNVLNEWSNANYHAKIHKGESALDLQARLLVFLSFLNKLNEEKILICSHGGTLAFLMTMLSKEPLSKMADYKFGNTAVSKFIFNGSNFELAFHNDISHLG